MAVVPYGTNPVHTISLPEIASSLLCQLKGAMVNPPTAAVGIVKFEVFVDRLYVEIPAKG